MSIKPVIVSIVVLALMGCAAAGVPYKNDPNQKLNQAYQLMNSEGRALPAEKLGLEALSQFGSQNNWYGVAESQYFLGTFYKSKVYRSYKEFYVKHNEYDPTSRKSISHFKEAILAFEKDGDYWGVSKSTFAMGNAYATDNDLESACSNYRNALEIYHSDKNVFKGRVHPHNPTFESYDSMIESFIEAKCKNA